MNADVIQKFKEEKMPISTASTEIGNAIVQLYQQVKESVNPSDYSPSKIINLKWGSIQTQLNDSVKVYNTILKTRYALENNLLARGKFRFLTLLIDS